MSKTKTEEKPIICNRLKYYRKLKGRTQRKVAEIMQIENNEISRLERCKYYPNLEVAFELAIIYRRPVEEVFGDLFEEKRNRIWQREKELGLLNPSSPPPLLYK